MDHESFDRLVRRLSAVGSRRSALGTLLGTTLAGAGSSAAAKQRGRARGKSKKVAAQAVDCSAPAHGNNYSSCDFDGGDFSGEDIGSARGVGATFRNAALVGADLSGSNLKTAVFRGADLCGADLSASTLTGADFRGFASPGNETNLTLADMHSSGCTGIQTNSRTIYCRTIGCHGQIINPDCNGCCTNADCGEGQACEGGACVVACPAGRIRLANGSCAIPCLNGGANCQALGCAGCQISDAGPVCDGGPPATGTCPSNSSAECPAGSFCVGLSCHRLCEPTA